MSDPRTLEQRIADRVCRPCPFPGERGPRTACTCAPCGEWQVACEVIAAEVAAVVRERDEARALADHHRVGFDGVYADYKRAADERDTLREQLASAKADGERLDWLWDNWRASLTTFDERVSCMDDGTPLRAAIDKQMTEEVYAAARAAGGEG
jgi:hypothetical protein